MKRNIDRLNLGRCSAFYSIRVVHFMYARVSQSAFCMVGSFLKYYLARSGGVKFGEKSSFTRCKVRILRQICIAIPSPPTYFNKLLARFSSICTAAYGGILNFV